MKVRIRFDWAGTLAEAYELAAFHFLNIKIIELEGLGGGHPELEIEGLDERVLDFLVDYHGGDFELAEEYFEDYVEFDLGE